MTISKAEDRSSKISNEELEVVMTSTTESKAVSVKWPDNKARLDFAKKHLKKPDHFRKSILWMAEIKINLYQNDGK